MENRHDNFRSGDTFFLVKVDGNTTAVIPDRDRFVRMDDHPDFRTVPSQCLVNGVVHQLKDHVMQARAIISVTDIHAGPLPNGIQSFQYLDA